MDPKGDKDKFAQCGSCFMFMPNKQRCSIFGKNDKVIATAACGLYVYGKPNNNQEWKTAVTPKTAGYAEGQMRCENCSWLESDNVCGLYKSLNRKSSDIFDLETKVDPKGCCNAFNKK
jgi:hypothetical protein